MGCPLCGKPGRGLPVVRQAGPRAARWISLTQRPHRPCAPMQNIEHNTVRLEEHGRTVMVLEKKTEQKSQGYERQPHACRLLGMER